MFPWHEAIDVAVFVGSAAALIFMLPEASLLAVGWAVTTLLVSAWDLYSQEAENAPNTGGTFCDEYGYCQTYSN
jgi:hypothetical protein